MTRRRRPAPIGEKSQDCFLCGWTYQLSELRSQKGGLVCEKCYDQPHSAVLIRKQGG